MDELTAICLAAGMGLGWRMHTTRSSSRGRPAESARWASGPEIRSLAARASDHRLPLGVVKGRKIAADSQSSVLVVGPTQSRKTSGFAIPALLEWQGPIVATSVKSDLARHTYSWRASCGEVWVYDPTAVTTLPGSRWSPLPRARTWSGARRLARSLTDVARSSGSSLSDGEFWYSTASKLLAPLLMAAAVSNRTMSDVVKWLDHQEVAEVADILEAHLDASLYDAGGTSGALQALRASWGRDERQRSGVFSTAETVVEAFADPAVGGAATGDIDPRRILGADNTLYVCAPAHDQRRLRPLFATLVTDVIEQAFEQAERREGPLDPPLLVVLDEAANVAPLPDLDVLASTAAGHGVRLVTVWQDLNQIGGRYGASAPSVVNNHRTKVFLSGISDPKTLEHASELIGDCVVPSYSRTSDGRRGSSTTQAEVPRRLLPADALRRILPRHAVVVSGHLPPIKVRLRPWYEDRTLSRRALSSGALAQSRPRSSFGSVRRSLDIVASWRTKRPMRTWRALGASRFSSKRSFGATPR
jgi:type IV secretion system protein VirD4